MTALETVHAIELRHITKRFGKVVANDDIDLALDRGEILSLLGENGSGKTTLMNMLSGIYFPDEGEILVEGRPVAIRSPKDAFDHGIGMIHQHFKLIDVFTAAENIVLGLHDGSRLDRREIAAKVKEISDRYGFGIDPNKKVYDMSVSEKQTVEIVKVLYRGADILILDEPTAVLTPQETDRLFDILRAMRADGKAIVIITHKLHEVMALSDKVAVLRKGKYIGTVNTAETNPQALTDMMVGHAVTLNIDRPEPVNPEPRLEIQGLTCLDAEGVQKLDDVSFTARTGQITAIVGPSGSGKSTIAKLMAGFWDATGGTVSFGGQDIQNIPFDQLMGEISYVAQDNFLFDRSIRENIRMGDPGATDAEVEAAARAANCHDFIMNLEQGYDTLAGDAGDRLSGGERQRITIARAMLKKASVIILDEATAFADPESEAQIQQAISRLVRGKTLIVVAHRLNTIQNADQILVIDQGRLAACGRQEELLNTCPLYRTMWEQYQSTAAFAGKEVN